MYTARSLTRHQLVRRVSALAASLSLLAGCGDDATTTSGTGEGSTGVDIVAAGDTDCPAGGVTVVFGSDRDGDGSLTGDEVVETATICNGEPGAEGGTGSAGPAGPDGIPVLVDSEDVPAGEECANGGVRVTLGQDDGNGDGTAGDGVLQDDEVDDSVLACNPVRDADQLVRVTDVGEGDADCPAGGQILGVGLDNGDGGGTAGDGVLQDGEVDAVHPFCDLPPDVPTRDTEPPAGDPGTAEIQLSGGASATDESGAGGALSIALEDGSLTGHVKLFRTGAVTQTVTLPDAPSDDVLGPAENVHLFNDTSEAQLIETIDVDCADPAAVDVVLTFGDVYTCQNERTVFRLDDDGGGSPAITPLTGFRVAEGVELVIEQNIEFDTAEACINGCNNDDCERACPCTQSVGCVDLLVPNGIVNLGEIHAENGDNDPDQLVLRSHLYHGGASSTVTALDFTFLSAFGQFVNGGTIDTSSDVDGGNGGDILVDVLFGIVNTGSLLAFGESVATGDGGDGGDIELSSRFGSIDVGTEALLDASGGATDEADMDGGNGGSITIVAGSGQLGGGDAERLTVLGTLSANGGDSDGDDGGDGGSVELTSLGGEVIVDGTIEAGGGAGADPDGDNTGFGGDGGSLTILADEGAGFLAGPSTPAGSIVLAATIDLSGGANPVDGPGGIGGVLDISVATPSIPFGQEITLLGYESIDVSGGNGLDGGAGGSFCLANGMAVRALEVGDEGFPGCETEPGDSTGGGIYSHVPITANGGNATSEGEDDGGAAGAIFMLTERRRAGSDDGEVIANFAALSANGGAGLEDGGTAGLIALLAANGVANSGAVSARGGDAGDGGAGQDINPGDPIGVTAVALVSDLGPVTNSAAIAVDGGSASEAGGLGGDAKTIVLLGDSVTNSGGLSAAGGDGGDGVDDPGGDGGAILLITRGTIDDTGTTNVDGGDVDGLDGTVLSGDVLTLDPDTLLAN